jgi:hypothetical protein
VVDVQALGELDLVVQGLGLLDDSGAVLANPVNGLGDGIAHVLGDGGDGGNGPRLAMPQTGVASSCTCGRGGGKGTQDEGLGQKGTADNGWTDTLSVQRDPKDALKQGCAGPCLRLHKPNSLILLWSCPLPPLLVFC